MSNSSACWRPRGIIGRILAQLNCTIQRRGRFIFKKRPDQIRAFKELRLSDFSCNPPGGLAEPD